MKINKKLLSWISSGIISTILLNFGIAVIKEEKYIGIITILIAFVLLYLSYYSPQIGINELKIKNLEEEINQLNQNLENQKELLNTLKDIVILKKVSKIK